MNWLPQHLGSRRRIAILPFFILINGACDRFSPQCPTCAQARLANQWCDTCKVGYVAGVSIKSKILFEYMDAHGHEVDLGSVQCLTCKAGIANDGYCEACRIGWVRKLGYFSRLTYHLAKGKSCDPATLACKDCRTNAAHYGWCKSCGVGMIGNVVIPTRADFDGGVRGFELMLTAIEATKRCELCPIAIMTDTNCFFCKTTYKDGKPIPIH